MSTEENKALVRRTFEETWNKGDLSLLAETHAADYVYNDPAAVDVVTSTSDTSPGSALSTDPPLNPNQPNHSRKTPIAAKMPAILKYVRRARAGGFSGERYPRKPSIP